MANVFRGFTAQAGAAHLAEVSDSVQACGVASCVRNTGESSEQCAKGIGEEEMKRGSL